MPAIEITLNAFLFVLTLVAAFGVGFLMRKTRIGKWEKKVAELEKEMLQSHAEILELQRDKKILEQQLTELRIPVIALTPTKEEKKEENAPDVAIRKKLLSSPPAKQKSI